MELAEILATIAALAGAPDMPDQFVTLSEGGFTPANRVAIAPCPQPLGRAEIEGQTIICGTMSVPENHDSPTDQTVELFFSVLRSHSAYAEPDPLLYLHGGPGGGTVSRIAQFAGIFDTFRRTRDVVMFDQRAAALSGASATCSALFSQSIGEVIDDALPFTEGDAIKRPSDFIVRCLDDIKANGRDITQYNTLQNARDVAALMTGLGYERYNIYGISYGSRLTLEVLRSAPAGVRAAIIDGVAPLQVPLYDTLGVPASEATDLLIAACAADEKCHGAYPDLTKALRDVLARAAAGVLRDMDGDILALEDIVTLLMSRNATSAAPSTLTAYLPALIYELAKQGDHNPVQQLLAETDLRPAPPDQIAALRTTLTDTEAAAVDDAVALAELSADAEAALNAALQRLRKQLAETDQPLVRILDDEMVAAADSLIADPEARRKALVAYAMLREGSKDRMALRSYVTDTFPPARQRRLLDLITAMSDAEVAGVFAALETGISQTIEPDLSQFHLMVYACQESLPFNSYDGFRTTTQALSWPEFGEIFDPSARDIFAACQAFEQSNRPGFHTPVVSDIPVLALGSDWDTQTAPSWSALAVETLANGQSFIVPEAGHAAIAYQPCVADMAFSFLSDPLRRLASTCPDSIEVDFLVPPD
ncbi:alpha/beta hydrolase [Roseobacter denitrificans]|uniref:Secreted peptidase of alpha/beta hydrolase superfamily, putative n=1 Tax=Roseobacter denitrificans (strain ATCC 33942 / OCh 114) TaxID=375451 RepID=Q165X1_ROSDO|nr:alpha/beta hydrolase [Roseobacter denitrificans]ABG32222.1 secreted peptidase of alpha/beta hydrolase superfamily, putative [Roseobacter denitrificans OCh 114]AVL51717.1 alpha/beta hydrolase [Roseobacter denitrificans]SFF78898.1 Pimeloyl-ACP methyl ester carboxylesterase [Roseobacter denitrificans OCh 114]